MTDDIIEIIRCHEHPTAVLERAWPRFNVFDLTATIHYAHGHFGDDVDLILPSLIAAAWNAHHDDLFWSVTRLKHDMDIDPSALLWGWYPASGRTLLKHDVFGLTFETRYDRANRHIVFVMSHKPNRFERTPAWQEILDQMSHHGAKVLQVFEHDVMLAFEIEHLASCAQSLELALLNAPEPQPKV